MNILHYALGFPPYRRGGLTKYCMDIMLCQIKEGNNVGMLWPGKMNILGGKTIIKKRSSYVDIITGIDIDSYEMINPLPVSLLEGVKDIEAFIRKVDITEFENFLDKINFDVIHFHTVMGLPYEFVVAARKKNIKLVITTHDYFGICPKLILMKNRCVCTNDNLCWDCVACNKNAISNKKLFILQSPVYRLLKESKLVKNLRKAYLDANEQPIPKSENDEKMMDILSNYESPYLKLRKYYIKIFESIDVIHFNSSLTREVYSRYMDVSKGVVINITHSNISDSRKTKEVHTPLQITYLGPKTEQKGYFLLREVLDELYSSEIKKFELNVYFNDRNGIEYLKTHVPYSYSELKTVMDSTDLLIMPSIWYETFGFTVLEALSYGVPVLISNNVGAKDLIENYKSGIIVEESKEKLKYELKKVILNNNIIESMNRYICNNQNIKTMIRHVKEINELYMHK